MDIEDAKQLLLVDSLGDFPFLASADRAHAMALLLLPFVREMISGPVPLHLIEKPSPGTGAGLLLEAITVPAMGRPPAVITEGRDEDEWRKRITSILLRGPELVAIDNVRRTLDSAALSAAITARNWEDRLLGQSRTASVPVRCAWVATANNPGLSHEMSRRSVPIRLDAKLDRPWEREVQSFRHPDLLLWAKTHRDELISACLCLISRWTEKGARRWTARTLGSFEGWAGVMGGILENAGIPGFLDQPGRVLRPGRRGGGELASPGGPLVATPRGRRGGGR